MALGMYNNSGGLKIAGDDPGAMRPVQSGRDAAADRKDFGETGSLVLTVDIQCRTVQILHGDEVTSFGALDGMDGEDVRMVELRCRPGFPE